MDKKICIVIPTLNEEMTIGDIVSEFRDMKFENIIVIDGHSTDTTVEKAEQAGAKVILQKGKGKGRAIQQVIEMIDTDIMVMIDGDGTNPPSEVMSLIEPVLNGEADHVIANRLSHYEAGALTSLNKLGNRLLAKLFGFAYGVWLSDILSGYRAFSRELLNDFTLNRLGFDIEAEMVIDTIKKGYKVMKIPITYYPRKMGSPPKLSPFKDGIKIAMTIYRLAKTYSPLFYFGVIGGVFFIAGLALGIYVTIDWFKGITHTLLTVLTALLIMLGVQLFFFGLLGDTVISSHKELMREFKKIKR